MCILNLVKMSIPNTLGVYLRSFSLSSLVTLGGTQITLKPLLYLILCSLLLDLKVRVTSRFIILVLNSPPKPMALPFDSRRREQSIPINVASFSVIAEKIAPVSTRKSIILFFLYAGTSKKTGIIGRFPTIRPVNLNVFHQG